MSASRSLDRLGLFLTLAFCLSWSVQQVAAKLAMPEVPALTQAAVRSVGACLIVGMWMWLRQPDVFRRDGTLTSGLIAGFFFALEFLLLFLGLQRTTASHAILFIYTAPLFVSLGVIWVAPDERLRLSQWLGLALAFIGVALALSVSFSVSRDMLIGDVLCLLAGIGWAITTLIIKGTKLRFAPASKILLYQLAVSSIFLVLAALVKGESPSFSISALAYASLAYQTIWVAAITFMGWMWLVAHYRAAELSALTFLTPVLGVLAGWAIMGDPLPPQFTLAVALLIAGLLLVSWPRKAPRPEAA
ncbi:MAG: hypothetical protein BGP04_11380 [Rhizobiales bacterium 62-17]|nr:DMT family transporter [Hyphomicrobiales bacterium]OJY06071.1 MAG: hypothetical protein BGP04_11380 [Rhizobiales bacterium 62-17]